MPQDDPQDQPGLALDRRLPHLLEPALRPPSAQLTSTNHPDVTEGDAVRPGGSRRHPGTPGGTPRHPPELKRT
jgi:hypothetical protein